MYIARAQVTPVSLNNSIVAFGNNVFLYINGVAIENAVFSSHWLWIWHACATYNFENIGFKVAAGQIIKIASRWNVSSIFFPAFNESCNLSS